MTNSIRRIHDGIVGAVVAGTVALGYYVDPLWMWVPFALGVILIQSGLTGFCPLYFVLNRTCGEGSACGHAAPPAR